MTDAPAAPIHDQVSCVEWCNHCTACGVGILYGSLCPDHWQRGPRHAAPESPLVQ